MMRSHRALIRATMLITAALLSACVTRPAPVVSVAAPAMPPAYIPMPAGTYIGMPVPAVLADGSYATPNRSLSSAGAVWHLRGGLNFAALGCRGAQEAQIVAGYNAMLAAHKTVLAEAERSLIAEYRASAGAQWRDAYDDAMTRLYNYYALAPARPALCAAALRLLAEAQGVAPPQFPAFAVARLPELDAAFTDVYRAYDAWRMQRPLSYALAANTPPAPRVPWIEVDPKVLRLP